MQVGFGLLHGLVLLPVRVLYAYLKVHVFTPHSCLLQVVLSILPTCSRKLPVAERADLSAGSVPVLGSATEP